MRDDIFVKGARENNLKNISVTIPRDKMVVFTGVSGSGKSSLAFDTIFAEGQRRYVESLSAYARQFLGQMDKPDVDLIEGLSPAISIDQKTTSQNPRSTVGTVTEIYDFIRLLYARVGTPYCPECGKEIEKQSVETITDRVAKEGDGKKVMIMAPIVRGRKGEYSKQLQELKRSGFLRVKIDGSIYTLDEEIKLDKNLKHNISVVIDRLVLGGDMTKRLSDSIEVALKLAEGLVIADFEGEEQLFSDKYACADCGVSIEEIEPRSFSFNSPFGACPDCAGLGFKKEIDRALIVRHPEKSLAGGAINVSGWNMDGGKMTEMYFNALATHYGFSMNTPYEDLPDRVKQIILYGSGGEKFDMQYASSHFSGSFKGTWEGIIPNLTRRYRETTSDFMKHEIEKFMAETPCDTCGGKRLKKQSLSVKVGGMNIYDLTNLSIDKLAAFFNSLELNENKKIIAQQILKEIGARLTFLNNVGLSYLTLGRSSGSLSGGEAQRIRLATQIGSGLMGCLYILDEPSIGLHQRDNGKLLASLKNIRDLGNTLIVVEHDEETIREADHIIDIGPYAGVHGGELVAAGELKDIIACKESVTGQYLSGEKAIPVPASRRSGNGSFLEIRGAKLNNLKNLNVKIPLGTFTAVTGLSGSGKSSLINGILYPVLANDLNGAIKKTGGFEKITGIENLDKIIAIDQSPIGRTPRSNPATYTGVFTQIRDLFAATQEAKERGFATGRFSFNVKGGRCEHCEGDGIIKIEMHFLSDVYVPCEVCKGKRYNRETLQVHYRGKNIADVLDMTVEEALTYFENQPSIRNKIQTLFDVGLGYIKLGQSATTLSGGEAQRVKLASELNKRSTGKTIYILDEPTTGLHMFDVDKLITILNRLTDGGNTVLVIEHNLDMIKTADYIIDLGPEGGDNGGRIIASGTPEEVAKVKGSYTGEYLKKILTEAGK